MQFRNVKFVLQHQDDDMYMLEEYWENVGDNPNEKIGKLAISEDSADSPALYFGATRIRISPSQKLLFVLGQTGVKLFFR